MSILKNIGTKSFPYELAHYFLASLALTVLALVCYRLRLNLATASLLYVVLVVLLARTGGFASSVFASVFATLCLASLAPPAFSLRIDDPLDGIAVAAFLFTSLVIAQLMFKLRRMAEEAVLSVDRRLVDAEQRERAWIARELHDDINQRLALAAINLERLQNDLAASDTAARQRLQQIQQAISHLSSDVQSLSHHLHSSKVEILGVVGAAKSLCRELAEKHVLEIDVQSEDVPKSLPQEVSLSLFRVLQEALQNGVKHSRSAQFIVGLRGIPGGIELSVHDAGIGFDLEAARKGRGLGLISMQERMKLVKGELSIASEVNRGTIIRARVPLNEQTPAP